MSVGLIAGAALSIGGGLYSGYSKYKAGKELSSQYRIEGEYLFAEAMREANIIEEEGETFSQSQGLQFIGAGVELAGSALITMAHTRDMASEEATAKRNQGIRQRDKAYQQAAAAKSEGKASLIGSIFSAGGKALTAYSAAKEAQAGSTTSTKEIFSPEG